MKCDDYNKNSNSQLNEEKRAGDCHTENIACANLE